MRIGEGCLGSVLRWTVRSNWLRRYRTAAAAIANSILKRMIDRDVIKADHLGLTTGAASGAAAGAAERGGR